MSGITDDGRNLDTRLGDVSGIAASQRPNHRPDRPMPGSGQQVWQGGSPRNTYYDQAVVKAPPWGWKVSVYLVAGGVAGTSAALGSAVRLLDGPDAPLGRAAMWLAAGSGSLGAALLVADLGRPERFLHMVRVVRPTSVMNVGGYLLSTTTGVALGAAVLARTEGLLGRVAGLAGMVAAAAGLPLSGYTGVLLGATAVPGWNVGLTTLPPLFVASGAASSGSLLKLLPLDERGRATVDTYTAAGQVAELLTGELHDRRVRAHPRIRAAYAGVPGWRVGKWLTAASLAIGLLPTRRRSVRTVAGLLGTAGSAMTKTAVFDAGMRTAADPLAVPETSGPPS